VAAVDEDTANEAVKLIEVEYEPLHAYLDPAEAAVRHDPAIHPDNKHGNISKHVRLEFGDVEAALAGSTHVVEDDYLFHGTAHAPIEMHCAIARLAATACSRSGRPRRSRTTCTARWRRCSSCRRTSSA
jgi:CO/xanthine dehydrogenase Mo-binding subunit